MPLRIAQTGDLHLEQDRYFTDTAQCLEWFVEDAIRADTNLFVVNGDLTTYKQTIQERNLWVDTLIQMGDHAPVILVAGNHGKELDGDLHVLSRAKAAHPVYLCTDPEMIEIGEASVAVFPYPRKAEMAGNEHSL
jgi:metallophosphoesterase superfamily enzyme